MFPISAAIAPELVELPIISEEAKSIPAVVSPVLELDPAIFADISIVAAVLPEEVLDPVSVPFFAIIAAVVPVDVLLPII